MAKFKLKKEVIREIWTLGLLLLAVFMFRSSIAEPYVVPTGSLKPVVLPGDRIFVYKAAYDLKIPFTDISLVHFGNPKRGDIIVFKYPLDTSINYVKRLIGIPGDDIEINDGWITLNGTPLEFHKAQDSDARALDSGDPGATFYFEKIGDVNHPVQRLPMHFPRSMRFTVPPDQYFFMGDNRDGSNDSRVWGFVPKDYLKGKALVIWLSLDSLNGWIPGWVPSVRWNRIGKSLTH
jgi:signal peptidase I